MPKYIIAIGGGEITNNDTISIDKTILALSENEKNIYYSFQLQVMTLFPMRKLSLSISVNLIVS